MKVSGFKKVSDWGVSVGLLSFLSDSVCLWYSGVGKLSGVIDTWTGVGGGNGAQTCEGASGVQTPQLLKGQEAEKDVQLREELRPSGKMMSTIDYFM